MIYCHKFIFKLTVPIPLKKKKKEKKKLTVFKVRIYRWNNLNIIEKA